MCNLQLQSCNWSFFGRTCFRSWRDLQRNYSQTSRVFFCWGQQEVGNATNPCSLKRGWQIGNDYKMILRVELWWNSPSWTLCMLPTGTEDEAVQTLLSSMDKTASGQARNKNFPQPNRGGWRSWENSARFSMTTLLIGWTKVRPALPCRGVGRNFHKGVVLKNYGKPRCVTIYFLRKLIIYIDTVVWHIHVFWT